MIQEQLGQQAEILAVQLEVSSIHLINAVSAFPINFLPRRLSHSTFCLVKPVSLLQPHILEAELAYPELGALPVVLWVGREIPGVYFEPSNLYSVDIFHLSKGLMLLLQCSSGGVHLRVSFLHMVDLVMLPFLVAGDLAGVCVARVSVTILRTPIPCSHDPVPGHPFVQTPVKILIVHVVFN